MVIAVEHTVDLKHSKTVKEKWPEKGCSKERISEQADANNFHLVIPRNLKTQGNGDFYKIGGTAIVSNKQNYEYDGTEDFPDNELRDTPEEQVASGNFSDELGINSYVSTYRVPYCGKTKVIPVDESQDIKSPLEISANDGRGVNVNVWIEEKYGIPESGGGKIIPYVELRYLKIPPDGQDTSDKDSIDLRNIQEGRNLKCSLPKFELQQTDEQKTRKGINTKLRQDFFLELESEESEEIKPNEILHIKYLFSVEKGNNWGKKPGKYINKKPKICVKIRNIEHCKKLIGQKLLGNLSHIRIKRRPLNMPFEYHHHYLVLSANNDGMTIFHLTTDSVLDMVCKKDEVDFSNEGHCENLLNFDLGVELLHRYDIPTNKTDLEAIQQRIKEMCELYYVEYSLTSPTKMYCESLVSYVLTGKKDCREVAEFTQHYGIGAKIIIFGVNNFCTLKSSMRRLLMQYSIA